MTKRLADFTPEELEARRVRKESIRERVNAERRAKRAAGKLVEPILRERLQSILLSYPEPEDYAEVSEWRRTDIYCPKCNTKMLTDQVHIWCNDCAYELKGMIA